jgi:hypothetical protein
MTIFFSTTKKSTFLKLILVLAISLSHYSCVQYKIVNIQTLKPSEFSIPKDFVQPLIMANLYKGFAGDAESMAQVALDSTAAMEAAWALSEKLMDSPWFEGLEIPIKTIYRDDSSHLIVPLSWPKVEKISQEENADLLISLEYIKVTPQVVSYPYWNGAMNAYYGSLTFRVYAYWRIYDLHARKVVADYLFRDTLTWENHDFIPVTIGNQLPGFFSSASYCGYLTGEEYAKKIAPSWMDEERLYFHTGSKEMRSAAEFASKNLWLDAAAHWQRVLQNPKVKPAIAAKAAYNMAVANEMSGNFDIALDWLDKSAQFYSLPEEPWYRKILMLRIKVLKKL